ncbi:hypothetical protein RQP54_18055 [Curvibacter sp. APW13]|uniref:hypothetical protein n=1 Tax=Curvibacter sp. APW13 TaxID=3077236 RepID=UPI0028DD6273|nr:hypothetical protein [Curvibacter sp. APW13]MDT8992782.1 hypothetical protein [Curvibacter sp. APW13]
MSKFLREVQLAAREAPRVYFAPLVGAAKEMQRQVRLMSAARRLPTHPNQTRKNVTHSHG